jgi:hypothetical protein
MLIIITSKITKDILIDKLNHIKISPRQINYIIKKSTDISIKNLNSGVYQRNSNYDINAIY